MRLSLVWSFLFGMLLAVVPWEEYQLIKVKNEIEYVVQDQDEFDCRSLAVLAMEISDDISDSWETNTGILGLLWECLLAEILGWLKYRTLGALSSRRDQENHTETALSCEASCFSTVHEKTRGDGGWVGGKRRESIQDQGWLLCIGPCKDFSRFLSFVCDTE